MWPIKFLTNVPMQFNKEKSHFNKWYFKKVIIQKRMNIDPHFSPHTKINSKQTLDVNIKAKTINVLEENIKDNLQNLGGCQRQQT